MSKVLVDRELLAGVCSMVPEKMKAARKELRAILAQPAEAEGVKRLALDVDCLYPSNDGEWCEYGDHLAALSAERARADVAVADANDAERALVAVTAERDRLQSQLAETQANDRAAMGYLHDVRQLVGGSDFPEMVRNVARMVDALPGCVELIEALSPIEGDVLRKARAAMAAKEA